MVFTRPSKPEEAIIAYTRQGDDVNFAGIVIFLTGDDIFNEISNAKIISFRFDFFNAKLIAL